MTAATLCSLPSG
ncbi:hypothetical protein ELJP6_10945 [Enterobacter ludwigii]|nr:hypothetical protein ELJP6_10945 [Enterobacter ludwigii]QCU08135.1 hypothetical protein ELJP9_10930 [Enterobacter ludwigii]QIN41896.1 hypothetical protein E5283_04180 [Enterobacter ludwigii]RTN61305.1 hypothetical protein EKN82_07470 [Enterobacter ludwigii]TYD08440.1 hypothetical protein E4M14_000330 [Enterobacter sp. Z1]